MDLQSKLCLKFYRIRQLRNLNGIGGNSFVRIDIEKPNYFGSNLTPKSPVLVIPKATFDDKGYYRLSIWNKFGENVSNTIELKITGSMFLFYKN